jgi:glycine/D-amino acid oxidase-like deaminating enzyme
MITDQSYWAATSIRDTFYSDNLPAGGVDCAVVGGGFTGLSAAYHLAKAGAKVAVLEREHMGWGASGRNGGMVLPGYKTDVDELARRYGLERARQMYDQSLEAVALVGSLVKAEKIACDFQTTGSLYAASKPAHFQHMREWQRMMAESFDHPTKLIEPGEMRTELGTDTYYGGLVDEAACGLHPAKYVGGLAKAAARAGASLHENAPAERITKTPRGFEVRTPRGTVAAKEVIVGTNGYTGGLVGWLRRRVIPIGSYIIATEPLEPELAERLIPQRRMVFDSKNMLYYFRVMPDHRMLFGGRASFTPTAAQTSGEILRRGMIGLFPELAKTRVEYSWGGTLGFTFDPMPHAGKIEGVHYSMGYCGHGVAWATYMGKRLADAISGASSDIPLADIPFPDMVLYRGRPWFLPLAGVYYRFLDWVS